MWLMFYKGLYYVNLDELRGKESAVMWRELGEIAHLNSTKLSIIHRALSIKENI